MIGRALGLCGQRAGGGERGRRTGGAVSAGDTTLQMANAPLYMVPARRRPSARWRTREPAAGLLAV